jgi:hypothetical protein
VGNPVESHVQIRFRIPLARSKILGRTAWDYICRQKEEAIQDIHIEAIQDIHHLAFSGLSISS